ncbi:MAG: small multi-drug export protein [Acutalibacteraceae bacterium]|nr:small multi-drug export protein [Acutalibacteraceae bacterium]
MSFFNTFLGKIVMTFLISMVPVIELRGAIPIGVGAGLSPWVAIGVSIVGNLVPVPFIIIFIKKIFAWLRKISQKLDGLVTRLEKRAEKKSETVQKYAFWGLFILVAIPLPGTGAWTGALVAAMLEMPLKKAFPAILLGVLGAAVIVSFVTYGAGALLFS